MTECRGVNLDLRSFICQPSCVGGGVKLSPLKHVDAFSAPVMESKEKRHGPNIAGRLNSPFVTISEC